jgi:hypothetical protein
VGHRCSPRLLEQQPWNANGKLLLVQNRKGAAKSSPIILDGETYKPLFTPCETYDNWDYRWHPSLDHANEQICVNKAGTELMWFDVVNCKKTRSWKLPFPADYGIGSGEGNVSADGRYVVISDSTRMVVVDMDPRGPRLKPYPAARIGPVYTFDPCSLSTRDPASARTATSASRPRAATSTSSSAAAAWTATRSATCTASSRSTRTW